MGKIVCISSGDHRERVFRKRDALIAEHLYLVPPIALRIQHTLPPSFDFDDLCQQGNLGLLNAATRYQPKTHGGTPFSAYARPVIRGTILDSVRRRHYTANTLLRLYDFVTNQDSTDDSGKEFRGEQESHNLLACPAPSVEISIDRKRKVKKIAMARAYLSDEQSAVFSMYYGVDQPSLATVAARLGIPEYRAVRAHTEALGILKDVLKVA